MVPPKGNWGTVCMVEKIAHPLQRLTATKMGEPQADSRALHKVEVVKSRGSKSQLSAPTSCMALRG